MKKNFLKGVIEKTGEDSYRVIASTNAIDRQGDSVDQKGWETGNYMKNPVMLWAHDYKGLPVAKVLNLENSDTQLIASYEFASAEANPFAAQVRALVDGGFINAVSVGFIAKERSGSVITRSELLEISFVPVPANQEALMLSYKELGIDDETIAMLNKGEVEDALDAQDMWEQKWEKWDEVNEILGALWNVYFNEETPVEDFSRLLRETVVLLSDVAGTDGEDVTEDERTALKAKLAEAKTPDNFTKFVGEMLAKEGRTLSRSTLKKIDAALDAGKSLITVLEELKASSTDGDGEEEKTEDPAPDVDPALVAEAEQTMSTVRSMLRASDRSTEAALGVITRFLDKKK